MELKHMKGFQAWCAKHLSASSRHALSLLRFSPAAWQFQTAVRRQGGHAACLIKRWLIESLSRSPLIHIYIPSPYPVARKITEGW